MEEFGPNCTFPGPPGTVEPGPLLFPAVHIPPCCGLGWDIGTFAPLGFPGPPIDVFGPTAPLTFPGPPIIPGPPGPIGPPDPGNLIRAIWSFGPPTPPLPVLPAPGPPPICPC